jgi:hypothetical protein
MEVSGQLQAPAALSPGQMPPVPTGEETRWAPEMVWMRWRGEKNPSFSQESNLGRPARSLVTKLTELPRLLPYVHLYSL